MDEVVDFQSLLPENRRITRSITQNLARSQFYRVIRLFEDSPALSEEAEGCHKSESRNLSERELSFCSKIDSFHFEMGDESEVDVTTVPPQNDPESGPSAAQKTDVEKQKEIQEVREAMKLQMENLQKQLAELQNKSTHSESTPQREVLQPSQNRPVMTHAPARDHLSQQVPNFQSLHPPRLSNFLNNSGFGRSGYQQQFDLSKWQIKFSGDAKDMSVNSFIFRIEHLAELHGVTEENLFSGFHCLLTGSASRWYWQLLEDHRDNPSLDYAVVKREICRHFRSTKTDMEIITELVQRKQQIGESFDDFYTDMHNLSFGLQRKMAERELVDIIKGNLRGQMAAMLFPLAIFTLADLKNECRRAEKLIREHRQKPRVVNEIMPDFEMSSPTESLKVEAFNSTSYNNNNNRTFNREISKPNVNNIPSSNSQNLNKNSNFSIQNKSSTFTNVQFCKSPFHLNLCFSCGMPVDHYKKNSSIGGDQVCKSTFHNLVCFLCKKADSYCEFQGPQPRTLNSNLAEVTGVRSQTQQAPEE